MIKRYIIDYKMNGGKNNNIWIFKNFFNDYEFTNIKNFTDKLSLYNDPRSKDRLSTCIDINKYKQFYDLIYKNRKFINTIKNIKNKNLKIKEYPSFPIEFRKYFTGSQGMNWHIDTSLFKPDAFEIVLTLSNSSDSSFEWIENGIVNKFYPKENDLVIVRPQSVQHRVTSVNVGERTILKFVIEFLENNKNTKKIEYYNEIANCRY
jgi:hypothetical protein